tara:strand:- start:1697 stop:2410 length:714 start_codon:yes stop_codon:yes gene_type:complete
MDSLYDKKRCAEKSINELLECLTNLETSDNNIIDELNKKNETMNQMNKKLLKEIEEKDSHINIMQQTIDDHANDIDNLTKEIGELKSVKEEENKFGMLKAKDKEISNLNKEIVSLKKELEQVNSKLDLMSNDNSISCEMNDIEESTSIVEGSIPVVEESTPIVEESTPVVEESNNEISDSDEDISFVIITHKKKQYYVEENNPNSKVYSITDDEDVGDIVGEMKDGKPSIYRKKKNN